MKATLTIQLDLPYNPAEVSTDELAQILFDQYINYATCAHLRDSMDWLCKSLKEGEPHKDVYKYMSERHTKWADICEKAKWRLEIDNIAG